MLLLEDLLKRSLRHVAIIGAFRHEPGSEPERPLTGTAAQVLENPDFRFGLLAKRTQKLRDGDVFFETNEVKSPAEVLQESRSQKKDVSEGMTVLPDGDGVLSQYLSGSAEDKAALIGARLVELLLDAADKVRPFEHRNFGLQLAEGFYCARESHPRPKELLNSTILRRLIFQPEFNFAMLNYLRAGTRQLDARVEEALEEGALKALAAVLDGVPATRRGEIKKDLVSEVQHYRAWLAAPNDGTTLANHAHFSVLDGSGEEERRHAYEAFRSENRVPQHTMASLRQLYGSFRGAHDQLADIAQSEPLLAFITEWYLETFPGNKDDDDLATTIFEAVFEKNPKAQPSKVPSEVMDAAKAAYKVELAKIIEAPGEESNDKIGREVAEAAIAEYSSIRRPKRAFERDELIGLMTDQLETLALKLFPGRDEIEKVNARLVVAFFKAQKLVDVHYDENAPAESVGELKSKLAPIVEELCDDVGRILADVPGGGKHDALGADLRAALEALLKRLGGDEIPVAVIKAILIALGEQEGRIEAAVIGEFQTAAGQKLNELGKELREAYRTLLEAPGVMTVAGSNGSVSDPRRDPATVKQKQIEAMVGEMLAANSETELVAFDDERKAEEALRTATAAAGVDVSRFETGRRSARRTGGDADRAGNEGDGAHESGDSAVPAKAFVRIKVPLTPAERETLCKKTTQVKQEDDGFFGKLRRRAEVIVDARQIVLDQKSKIVADSRVVAGGDGSVGKELAAGCRFLGLGEHFLSVPSQSAPIGKPDTSFNAKIVLHLMRNAGVKQGAGERHMLQKWRQTPLPKKAKDTAKNASKDADPQDCDDLATRLIRQVPLWEICQVSFDAKGMDKDAFERKFRHEATNRIAGFIGEVRTQTRALLRLRDFFQDVEEVKALLRQLRSADGCEVTFINMDLESYLEHAAKDLKGPFADYPVGGPLFNGRRNSVERVPPGIAFVTRQASATDAKEPTIDGLGGAIGLQGGFAGSAPLALVGDSRIENSFIKNYTHPGLFGVPLFVGRGIKGSMLPAIGFDIPAFCAFVTLLTGGNTGAIKEFRDRWGLPLGDARVPINIGPDETVLRAFGMLLQAPEVIQPMVTATVLRALAHQRQFGPIGDLRVISLNSPQSFVPMVGALNLVTGVKAAIASLEPIFAAAGHKGVLAKGIFLERDNAWESSADRPDQAAGSPKHWIAFNSPPTNGQAVDPHPVYERL